MREDTSYTTWTKSYALKYWWVFIVLSLLTLVSIGLTLLSPVPLAFMADYVFGTSPNIDFFDPIRDWSKEQLLLLVVASYLLIHIVAQLYEGLRAIIEQKLFQMVDARAMNDVFGASILIPYNSTKRNANGKYIYQITDQSQVMSSHLFDNFSVIFQSTLTIVAILSILVFIDLQMTLFALLIVPVLISIVRFFGKRIEKRAETALHAESDIFDHVSMSLEKVRTIQEFSLENRKSNELHSFIEQSNRADRKLLFLNRGYSISTESAIIIAIAAIVLASGNLVLQGSLTFGALLLFINYISSMSDPLVTIAQTIGGIREQIASLKSTHTVLTASENLRPTSGSIRDIPLQGHVAFNHVYHAIDDKVIADDITIEFTPGSVYVITGPSGEGKSTLLSMVQRFVQPLRGTVTIDGIDVRNFDINYLRSNVAVVDQQPELFTGSVQDNIVLADPKRQFSLLGVMAAAHMSNSDEFIQKLPKKYDTAIGDQKLSGGQKQRLSIARASYREAPIMIMDEPTSALDKRSAELFIHNLARHSEHKTILVITHDANVIQQFEHVYVLKDGKLSPLNTEKSDREIGNHSKTPTV